MDSHGEVANGQNSKRTCVHGESQKMEIGQRVWPGIGMAAITSVMCRLWFGPHPQALDYHEFADTRTVGMSHMPERCSRIWQFAGQRSLGGRIGRGWLAPRTRALLRRSWLLEPGRWRSDRCTTTGVFKTKPWCGIGLASMRRCVAVIAPTHELSKTLRGMPSLMLMFAGSSAECSHPIDSVALTTHFSAYARGCDPGVASQKHSALARIGLARCERRPTSTRARPDSGSLHGRPHRLPLSAVLGCQRRT
jgi:hypothetical protein